MVYQDTTEFSLRTLAIFDQEPEKCRFIIKSSHDYITSFDFTMENLNQSDVREELIKKVLLICEQLDSCKIISDPEKPDTYPLRLFSIYKANIYSLLNMIDNENKKLSASCLRLIHLFLSEIKRFPLQSILSMAYKYDHIHIPS
jgi:hypothetical protein